MKNVLNSSHQPGNEENEKIETSDPNDLALENKALRQSINQLLAVNKELLALNYMSNHQMKAPLRKIQFFADEILLTEFRSLSARGKESFTRMNNAAKGMQVLIADLLEFSKANATETTLEWVDINTILNNAQDVLAEISMEKNAAIKLVGEPGEARVNAFQFQQAIIILLSNAIKFSKKDIAPNIIISGTTGNGTGFINENPAELNDKLPADNHYYKLSITDNGIGFDSQHKDKIFEPFEQLHDTKDYPGNGIGLAVVKKIIENHRGIITADSKPGEGSTFNIYIPG
jgi:signal transduction histidine kinase